MSIDYDELRDYLCVTLNLEIKKEQDRIDVDTGVVTTTIQLCLGDEVISEVTL